MAVINIILPAMGEGVIEATITKWLVQEGTTLKEDDPVVEVATDKVDTEIPAPAPGILTKIIAMEGAVVKVGETIALIENADVQLIPETGKIDNELINKTEQTEISKDDPAEKPPIPGKMKSRTPSGRFISPLVRSIAAGEGISYTELDSIRGSGMEGRITKDDILDYIRTGRKTLKKTDYIEAVNELKSGEVPSKYLITDSKATRKESETINEALPRERTISSGDEIIEMDRVRKIIAEHMVMSKRTSPHVTSFIDADLTRIVNWRNKIKDRFYETEGQKITLTPVFIEAAALTLYDYPMVNISVEGTKIIKRKNINIGMATALPDGNLIVPVIKNANEKSITGLAKAVNDLADRARNNKLKPDEITGGTFTVTNYGTYNNLAGTPIINQPQCAILGIGAVRKTPAVVETPDGDVIAIRHIVILSLSYDHRVIDGALAGKFLNRIKDILENRLPGLY
jgi:2-oxoglutarate dehydrogenase E2 component (dihydrolipoamide succinyltransferase)